MKLIIALAFFIASVNALPQLDDAIVPLDSRLITGQIEDAIKGVSQSIKDAGLDPFIINREAREYALPVPVLFNAAALIEDVLSFGLSDIRINRLSYNILTSRLNFDLELPLIHFSVGEASGEVTIFGEKAEASVAGSVDINSVRVIGQVQVRVSIISGISIRNITINFTLRSIYSHLKIIINGIDLSDVINTFLGQTIPETLRIFKRDIDTLLEIVIRDLIEANL